MLKKDTAAPASHQPQMEGPPPYWQPQVLTLKHFWRKWRTCCVESQIRRSQVCEEVLPAWVSYSVSLFVPFLGNLLYVLKKYSGTYAHAKTSTKWAKNTRGKGKKKQYLFLKSLCYWTSCWAKTAKCGTIFLVPPSISIFTFKIII